MQNTTEGKTDADIRYDLGQILGYFEIISYLINRKIINEDAYGSVYHHIEEVWDRLNSDTYYKNVLDSLISSQTTFEQSKIMIAKIKKTRLDRYDLLGA